MSSPSTPRASAMRLYDHQNRRLYLNAAERRAFLLATRAVSADLRSFCLTLAYTGCRLSEAIELTPASVQLADRRIAIRSLKKREKHCIREVPIPPCLAEELNRTHTISALPYSRRPLWPHGGRPVYRTLAYRWVKQVMAIAGITGVQASPKGLRHGYGIHAIRSKVPMHMLSKWMGHASIETTAIYAMALGEEELEIADRMWG